MFKQPLQGEGNHEEWQNVDADHPELMGEERQHRDFEKLTNETQTLFDSSVHSQNCHEKIVTVCTAGFDAYYHYVFSKRTSYK